MDKEQTGTGTDKAAEKKTRKRRPGEYRYQVKNVDDIGNVAWTDFLGASFKGPAEALAAAGKESPGMVVRVVRVASPEFEIEAVTTTSMKRVK